MLVPIRATGKWPPLFFVHDQHGVMALGKALARTLGPEQPLFAIHGNGIDGRQAPSDDIARMTLAYIADIHGARPFGPLLIGGIGSGSLLAMEIARELQDRGRIVGPVILLDPPPMPGGLHAEEESTLGSGQQPVGGLLYQGIRRALLGYASGSDGLPFNPKNHKQLHLAVLAGLAVHLAFSKYIAKPFEGIAEVLLSAQAAEAFFHPQMAWQQLLPGVHAALVVPWNRAELLGPGLEPVMDSIKFLVEEAIAALSEKPIEASVA